jgi:hypothetical protein
MKFKVHSLMMAAVAVAAVAPLARAADSVVLLPTGLAGATAVGGGALPGTHPTLVSGDHLYIYGSSQPGVYSVNYSVLANLAAGEGFGGIGATFVGSSGVIVPPSSSTPNPYTADASPVWTSTLPGNVTATINNFYQNNALVANIGPYTSADTTRLNFAQGISAPVGSMTFQWNGTTNNATVKIGDATNDGVLGQLQYTLDNPSTGTQGASLFSGGSGTVQFITALAGDANLDGKVDVGDLGILSTNFGKNVSGGVSQGDFNGDGTVNVGDLGILSTSFGKVWTTGLTPAFGAMVAAAPEPASLSLFGLASIVLLRRRNKSA